MIATNEALDVLRHGWQDAASTLAGDVPEVAELLQARLEMAIATGRLEENQLLETIQEVESVTSRAGSPSSQDLALRLRRTVYEYLLALDAARPSETAKRSVDRPAASADTRMVGAEEVAALGHAASSSRTGEQPTAAPGATAPVLEVPEADADALAIADPAEETVEADAPTSRRRFALRRRQRHDDGAAERVEDGVADPAVDDRADEPTYQFTPAGSPAMLASDLGGPTVATDSGASARAAGDHDPAEGRQATNVDAAPPSPEPEAQDVAADPALSEPEPQPEVTPGMDADAEPAHEPGGPTAAQGFVAPRAGFHIVEDTPAHRRVADETVRLQMPAFSADEAVVVDVPPGGAESEFLAWRANGGPAPELAAPHSASEAPPAGTASPVPAPPPVPSAPPQAPQPATFDATAAHGAATRPLPTAPAEPNDVDDDSETRGWGVRRHGDARPKRGGGPAITAAPIEDDPFENNSRLSDLRRRIEERLRRKRCDEAAALLQQLAQETGGRAVAELAMNAGDRCRALGKSNAALNCYLAAARSDPVYEQPLSRLADICIDNQDTELAVSYLERIARLYRYRGDDKAALRVYRRIATVAPYREDVLNLLSNAQRTGQLE